VELVCIFCSWEVQLVLEYCDQGSLRQLLNKSGPFKAPDGGRDMLLILDTALDVARAMVHLHSENIIHSDLKVRTISKVHCQKGCMLVSLLYTIVWYAPWCTCSVRTEVNHLDLIGMHSSAEPAAKVLDVAGVC
jgi:serine/threonine protein kinase